MAGFIGMIMGGTFAMILGGHFAAWIIRKIGNVAAIQSYLIGLSLMTFVGAWSITYDSGPSFLQNWILYVVCAAIALPLMIFAAKCKQVKT